MQFKVGLKIIFNKKRICLLLIGFFILLTLNIVLTPPAKAAFGLEYVLSPQKGVLTIIAFIIDLIFWMLAQIVALLGAIVDFILQMDRFSDAEEIKLGWRLLRDFANMSFVLILLVMAFATIFGLQSYGMKKLLPKLIIAALLINFSLTIAGFMVDLSQYLSRFFINAGVSGSGVSSTLAHGLSISRLLKTASTNSLAGDFVTGLRTIVISLVMGSGVLLVTGFAFGALAMMLFVRVIYIWLLLIVSPIVWILWILPATKKLWDRWWRLFLRWVFFAPIFCFFLYLALKIIEQDMIRESFSANSAELRAATSALDFASAFFEPSSIISYILIIGLVLGGLIMANSFGIAGAAGAMNLLKKSKDKGTAWVKTKSKAAAKRVGGAAAEKGLSGVAGARIPLVSKAAEWGHAKVKTSRAEGRLANQRSIIESKKKKYTNWTDNNIINAYEQTLNSRERAAILEVAAQKGIVGKLETTITERSRLKAFEANKEALLQAHPDMDQETIIKTSPLLKETREIKRFKTDVTNMERKFGADRKGVLKASPHLSETPVALEEIVKKLKPSELARMSSEAWRNKEVQKTIMRLLQTPGGFNQNHLRAIAGSDNTEIIELAKEILNKSSVKLGVARKRPDLVSYLNSPDGKGAFAVELPATPRSRQKSQATTAQPTPATPLYGPRGQVVSQVPTPDQQTP